jgi:hypothetical protein
MGKLRPQDLILLIENDNNGIGGRPQRSRDESKKKKGRIYTEEEDFPTKKKDSYIGVNKRERNRR